jgi:hypothetical protein
MKEANRHRKASTKAIIETLETAILVEGGLDVVSSCCLDL